MDDRDDNIDVDPDAVAYIRAKNKVIFLYIFFLKVHQLQKARK